MFLAHAHIDHCGALPILYNQGFTGSVYATCPTMDLAILMMNDIANTTHLYTLEDVKKIQWITVDDNRKKRESTKYFTIQKNF